MKYTEKLDKLRMNFELVLTGARLYVGINTKYIVVTGDDLKSTKDLNELL